MNQVPPEHTIKKIFEKAMDFLEKVSPNGALANAKKYADLQDLSLYYLAYLEEEAQDAFSVKEYKEVKKRLEDKGLLKNTFNS